MPSPSSTDVRWQGERVPFVVEKGDGCPSILTPPVVPFDSLASEPKTPEPSGGLASADGPSHGGTCSPPSAAPPRTNDDACRRHVSEIASN